MKGRKKRESPQTEDPVEEVHESFKELLEVISEDIKERASLETDPFNSYVQVVHGRLHNDLGLFKTRFAKGYQVLVDQLKTDQNHSENAKK